MKESSFGKSALSLKIGQYITNKVRRQIVIDWLEAQLDYNKSIQKREFEDDKP